MQLYGVSPWWTFDRVTKSLDRLGFEVFNPRQPVLPLTHKFVDASTNRGIMVAERAFEPESTAASDQIRADEERAFERNPFSSLQVEIGMVVLAVEIWQDAAEQPTASMDVPLPHEALLAGGRVNYSVRHGKFGSYKVLHSVSKEPWMDEILQRIEYDVKSVLERGREFFSAGTRSLDSPGPATRPT